MYDDDILRKVHGLIGNGKVFIDAGANRGFYTKYFIDTMRASKVHAFEIIPTIFANLKENLSGYDNVVLYPIGLSAREAEVNLIGMIPNTVGAFWFWYTEEQTHTPKQMGYPKHQHDQEIPDMVLPTKPLDSFGIEDKISFMKIDVEGMEMEVLGGAKNLIERDHPILFVEVCKKNDRLFRRWCRENKYVEIGRNGPCLLVI